MYANFLYFIIALLILSLYQPVEDPRLPLFQAMTAFGSGVVLFAIYSRTIFIRLVHRNPGIHPQILDQALSRTNTRQSILAMALFTFDVWALDLPTYLKIIPLFKNLPTLSDLAFLLVFIGYLTIIWHFGFSAQQTVYDTAISRKSYIYSNLAFSIPILIPYALLSGIMDIILLLPFALPKQILNTSIGQTGYFLVFLLLAALFAPVLVQRFWRCRPMEPGPARQRIEALCQRAGVGYADIVYWPIFGGRMITAGVMGLAKRFRYILVTKALLQLLHADEVDQVIAHEIGHVRRKHLMLYLLFFIGFMLVSYTIDILVRYLVFLNPMMISVILNWGLSQSAVYKTLSSVLLIAGVILYFRYLFGYFMRNFERQADGYVFRLFPSAQPLINTFGKIVTSSGQSPDKPNWHHYSIRERVAYLRQCETSPEYIMRHDRKMRLRIGTYLAGLLVLALAVFQFNQFLGSQTGSTLSLTTLEAYLDQKQPKIEQDALSYLAIGNLYFERQENYQAALAYEKGLKINPHQSDILNNLAWLLATDETSGIHDPEGALILARKAISLKKAPHIWDTLAECLFINGFIQEAIQAEHKALALDPDDRSIYKNQLVKFENALTGR